MVQRKRLGEIGVNHGLGDWVVSTTIIREDGTVLAGANAFGYNGIILIPGRSITVQLISVPLFTPVLNAPPPLQEYLVAAVKGSFDLIPVGDVPASVFVSYGIYISKYDTLAGNWELRFPVNSFQDAARDDWLCLDGAAFGVPAFPNVTDYFSCSFPVGLPHPVVITAGQALHAVFDVSANGVVVFLQILPFLRTLITHIA